MRVFFWRTRKGLFVSHHIEALPFPCSARGERGATFLEGAREPSGVGRGAWECVSGGLSRRARERQVSSSTHGPKRRRRWLARSATRGGRRGFGFGLGDCGCGSRGVGGCGTTPLWWATDRVPDGKDANDVELYATLASVRVVGGDALEFACAAVGRRMGETKCQWCGPDKDAGRTAAYQRSQVVRTPSARPFCKRTRSSMTTPGRCGEEEEEQDEGEEEQDEEEE